MRILRRKRGAVKVSFHMLLLLLLLFILQPGRVHAFFGPFVRAPSSSSPQAPQKPPASSAEGRPTPTLDVVNANEVPSIRIRKTIDSDIPYIAEMLATAVVSERDDGISNRRVGQGWRGRIDQMFAKKDIEELLRGRLMAMEKGATAWKQICRMYANESEENRLKVLWATTDVPSLIEKASQQTGEDNLWQTHNFVLTPTDTNWFNHLQITAEDTSTGTIVGFCEVAMLSNPSELDRCRVTTAILDLNEGGRVISATGVEKQLQQFSPGITNLATSLQYRRQGIGTRLLRHTERFVSLHWNAERLGLFVEKANAPAFALYSKVGYQPEATCDGGDVLGDLWYMAKALTVVPLVRKTEEDRIPVR